MTTACTYRVDRSNLFYAVGWLTEHGADMVDICQDTRGDREVRTILCFHVGGFCLPEEWDLSKGGEDALCS